MDGICRFRIVFKMVDILTGLDDAIESGVNQKENDSKQISMPEYFQNS